MQPRGAVAVAFALAVFAAVPLVYMVASFAANPGTVVQVLGNPTTWAAVADTLILAGGAAACAIALALPLAWLTHATDLPGIRFLRILVVLPLAVPSYVGGFVVILVFAPGGIAPIIDPYGLGGTVAALSFTYPLALLVLRANLVQMDPREWEAARSLGCSPTQAFCRVVLPGMRRSIASGGLLVALYAVGDFGAVSLLRYDSLSRLIYTRFKSLFARDQALILCGVLVLCAVILIALNTALAGKKSRQPRPSSRPWPTIALGAWRWPAFGFVVACVGVFLALPAAVAVNWLIRGVRLGADISWPWAEVRSTTLISAVAAAVTTAVALIPGVVHLLGARIAATVARTMSFTGYALPGIVVALALVSLSSRHAPSLYQTSALLTVAYLIRFLPLGLASADEALSGQAPQLLQAARSLGASSQAAIRRVVLPVAWPGIAAGFLAVFIAVAKELPATLILSPLGFETLATRIWGLTEDAYFAAAAPSVLLLIVVATGCLLIRIAPSSHGRHRTR